MMTYIKGDRIIGINKQNDGYCDAGWVGTIDSGILSNIASPRIHVVWDKVHTNPIHPMIDVASGWVELKLIKLIITHNNCPVHKYELRYLKNEDEFWKELIG